MFLPHVAISMIFAYVLVHIPLGALALSVIVTFPACFFRVHTGKFE